MLRNTQVNVEPIAAQNNKETDKQQTSDFVEIPLREPPVPESKDFANATAAFKTLLDETVLSALSKHYSPSMNIFEAMLDALYEDGKFSWIRTSKLAGALAIGGLASVFVINPSGTSAQTIQQVIKDKTGIDLTYKQILTRVFQTANTAESAALGTFSGLTLIEAYLGHATKAENFLKYQDATCGEVSKKIGRKIFDLVCAGAANVPTFFFAKSTNIYLAFLTAIANTSISWLGVSSLPLTPSNIHPARKMELAYMNEQLETFLKLAPPEQNRIMDEIDLLQKSDDVDKHKKIFARMLNLARPAQSAVAVEPVKIQQAHPQSTTQQVLANALGVYITIGQINYSEATYSGISHLFSDTSSPQAITTGAIAALFSLLPNVGFGFYTGTKTANAVMTDNVPLAKLYMSKTREILKYTIDFISLFAGGTTMAVAMDASADYVTLTHMKETLSAILKVSQGLVAYTGGAIVDAYYTQRLCDEILIYLAQRCGDENTKRLFTFVLETRRLHKILWETNEENYLELLTWKMEGNTELSDLMHIVFDNRMSDGQYNKTQQDLNKISKVMKDRIQLPHYQVIPSFFAKEAEEMQQRHPGLRHRVCGLFSRCKNQDGSRDIESHGVEMQQRR